MRFVQSETLAHLERDAAETDRMDAELDALRLQVSEKAGVANKKLEELRIQVQALKQIVKRNFDQTRWETLGVPDKR